MKRAMIFTIASVFAAATASYATPPAANNASEKAADPRDRIVCRSHVETGSLARIIRTCKTRREWDADTAAIRATVGRESCRTNGMNGDVVCE
jgi:hypothetical protein